MKYLAINERFMAVPNLSPCAKEFNAVKCLEFVFFFFKCEIIFQMGQTKVKTSGIQQILFLCLVSITSCFREAYCYEEETIHPFPLVYQKIYLFSIIGVSIFKNCFLLGSALYPQKGTNLTNRKLSTTSQLHSTLNTPVRLGKDIRKELRSAQ